MSGKVYVKEGNLLQSDCTVWIHQANCQGVMGAGIAKQIVSLYPSVLDADRQYKIPIGSRQRMGRTSHVWVRDRSLLIVNLYGQYRYGKGLQTEYEAFERGLRSILERIERMNRPMKIGMPFGIGCGHAGGSWSKVFEIIKSVAKEYEQDIYLYRLSK